MGKRKTPAAVLKFLRKIGRKGGAARARRYDTATFRKWAIESGAGRPRKQKRDAK